MEDLDDETPKRAPRRTKAAADVEELDGLSAEDEVLMYLHVLACACACLW